jgi:hypothetical protein
MRLLLVLCLLISFSSHAKLQNLTVVDGNFSYDKPYGTGDVQKIQFGISKNNLAGPYAIEIFREENALLLKSEFVDFSWLNPMTFFHDMDKLTIAKGNIQIGYNKHSLTSPRLMLKPKDKGEFTLQGLTAECAGASVALNIEARLVDDCLEHSRIQITRVDIPDKSMMMEILSAFPEVPAEEDQPAWDFDLKMDKGDFYMDFRIKYVIYAGVYAWGHVQFEDDRKVAAIRLDKVKYGYLGVTNLVFNKLREMNLPNVTINEPWIRVKMGTKK